MPCCTTILTGRAIVGAAVATCRSFFTYNVTHNVVYVTATVPTSYRVYALNIDTGKELWAQPYTVSANPCMVSANPNAMSANPNAMSANPNAMSANPCMVSTGHRGGGPQLPLHLLYDD